MDTIALWEEEIAESNRSHFFENTARAIDYLMESIELDYKLVEAGIITEADEEVTSSSDDNDASSSSEDNATDSANSDTDDDNEYLVIQHLKVGKKIKLFFEKIAKAVKILIKKIANYFADKVKKFQKDHIQDKFMNGEIDEEKLREKLNKGNVFIFIPKDTYEHYCENGIFGNFYDRYKNIERFTDDDEKYLAAEFNEYRAKMRELEGLENPEDYKKKYTGFRPKGKFNYQPLQYEFYKSRDLKSDIKKLYDDTLEYMDKIKARMQYFEKAIEQKQSKIDKIKTKKQLKHAKSCIEVYKACYQGCVRISGMYLKQSVFLANLMLGFSRNGNAEEGNTEENTEKEEA